MSSCIPILASRCGRARTRKWDLPRRSIRRPVLPRPQLSSSCCRMGSGLDRLPCNCPRPTRQDAFSTSGACRPTTSRLGATSCGSPSASRKTGRSGQRCLRSRSRSPIRRQMRLSTTASLLLAAVVLFTSPATHAQQADQTPRFRAATSAVIVDVVVRDGEGRLVTNLTKDEFRITENGDPQMIDSFRVVGVPAAKERTGDASSSFERALGQPAGAPETHVVGLVFDRLSLEARLLAQRATLSYLHDAKR